MKLQCLSLFTHSIAIFCAAASLLVIWCRRCLPFFALNVLRCYWNMMTGFNDQINLINHGIFFLARVLWAEDELAGIDNRVGGWKGNTTKLCHESFRWQTKFSRKAPPSLLLSPFLHSDRATMANKRQASQKPTIAQKKLSNVFPAKENFWSFSSSGSPASLFPTELHSAATTPSQYHSRKLPTKHAQTQHGSCSIKISILILETKASYTWHFSAETNVGVGCAKRRQINWKQNCFTAFFIFLCLLLLSLFKERSP